MLRKIHTCTPTIPIERLDYLGTFWGQAGFVHATNGLLHGKRDMVYTPTGTCLPFSRKLFVTVNGKILPCERIGHQYALGHVDEERVRLDFQEIADRYNGYYNMVRDQCHDCYNTQSCQQCLFYLDIEKENPECKGFMNADEFEKYLSACMSFWRSIPESMRA